MSRETVGEAWKISKVAAHLGIPSATIRSWERRYGLTSERSTGGHRRYTATDLDFLAALRDEIAGGRPTRHAVELVRHRIRSRTSREEVHVQEFVSAAMALDGVEIRRALDAAAMSLPVEEVLQDVLMPAMRTIGSCWEANTITVAHEHLASRRGPRLAHSLAADRAVTIKEESDPARGRSGRGPYDRVGGLRASPRPARMVDRDARCSSTSKLAGDSARAELRARRRHRRPPGPLQAFGRRVPARRGEARDRPWVLCGCSVHESVEARQRGRHLPR